MTDIYSPQPSYLAPRPHRRMSRLIVIALLFVAVVLFVGKMSLGREITISKEDNPSLWNRIIGQLPFARSIQDDPDYATPAKENDRLDILVLGMRGTDEPENGGGRTH